MPGNPERRPTVGFRSSTHAVEEQIRWDDRMRRLLFGTLVLTACASVPAPPVYDPSCFAHSLPVGVPYPSPADPLEHLFARPRIEAYPRSDNDPAAVITVRRVGPYSEPEAQLSLIEAANGEIRAELYIAGPCSVSDQMYASYVRNPQSTERERLLGVLVKKTTVTEREFPELRRIYDRFQHLRLRTNLFKGLVLDARVYHLWVETPLERLEMSASLPDTDFAEWAERAVAAVDRYRGR